MIEGFYLFHSIFGNSRIKTLQLQVDELKAENIRLSMLQSRNDNLLKEHDSLLNKITNLNSQIEHMSFQIKDLIYRNAHLIDQNTKLTSSVNRFDDELNTVLTNRNKTEMESKILLERLQQSEQTVLDLSTHIINDIYRYEINSNIVFYRMNPNKGFEEILNISSEKDKMILSNDNKYLYFTDNSNQSLYPVEKISETYFRVFKDNKWLVFIKETQKKLILKEPENGIFYNGFGFKIVDDSIKGPVVKETNVDINDEFNDYQKSHIDYKDMETFTGQADWHSDWQTEK